MVDVVLDLVAVLLVDVVEHVVELDEVLLVELELLVVVVGALLGA